MAQNKKRYFRLLEHIGIEGDVKVDGYDDAGNPIEVPNERAGELEPLKCVGIRVAVPVMRGQQIAEAVRAVEVTPDGTYHVIDDNGKNKRVGLPNTDDKVFDAKARVVEMSTDSLIDGLLQSGQYEEIEAPKSAQSRKPTETASAGKES